MVKVVPNDAVIVLKNWKFLNATSSSSAIFVDLYLWKFVIIICVPYTTSSHLTKLWSARFPQ